MVHFPNSGEESWVGLFFKVYGSVVDIQGLIISAIQQSDLVIHIHTSILSDSSHTDYHRILDRVLCAIQQVSLANHST